MDFLLIFSISFFSLLFILLVILYKQYRKELHRFLEKLPEQSKLIDTAEGTIEYAERGKGPALLFSHGSACGFELGIMVGKWIQGYRVISPSRFGYLRTPMVEDVSPERQADAFCALLDHLGIQQVALVGISGGGPAALYFALKYPDRCWALCMLSAITQSLPQFNKSTQFILTMMSSSSFFYWLLAKMFLDLLIRASGINKAIRKQFYQDHEALQVAREIMRMFPVHMRRPGTLKDLQMCRNLESIPVEQIRCPTMVVHGEKDPLVPYRDAKFLTTHIPHAQLLSIKDGGHFSCVTYRTQVYQELHAFLSCHDGKE